MSQQAQCMTPNCGNKPKARGLCHVCYMMAHKLVTSETTTWEQLAELGLCLSAVRKVRQQRFRSAFEEAIAKSPKGVDTEDDP